MYIYIYIYIYIDNKPSLKLEDIKSSRCVCVCVCVCVYHISTHTLNLEDINSFSNGHCSGTTGHYWFTSGINC